MRPDLGFLTALLLTSTLVAGCGVVPASPAALTQFTAAGADPEGWVRVTAGPFKAGSHLNEARVDQDFEIMVTPVTNAQFARYLTEATAKGTIRLDGSKIVGPYPGDAFHGGKHEKPISAGEYLHMPLGDPAVRISYDGTNFVVKPGYENHPVTMVTWFGAKAYCDVNGGRLPTELEWEKAARGTDGRPYPWGETTAGVWANFYHSGGPFQTPGGYNDTSTVGFYNGQKYGDFQTMKATSPYGLYDMSGNVAQWTADVKSQVHYRFLRGGSKANYGYDTRVWSRNSAEPDYASPNVGFRCVRTPGK